jgi:hypothetical protein
MGAQAEPVSIIISTQAPTDADLLSTLIDAAQIGDSSKVKLFVYAAAIDDDPWSEESWKAANPALGDFLSLEDGRQRSRLRSFRLWSLPFGIYILTNGLRRRVTFYRPPSGR